MALGVVSPFPATPAVQTPRARFVAVLLRVTCDKNHTTNPINHESTNPINQSNHESIQLRNSPVATNLAHGGIQPSRVDTSGISHREANAEMLQCRSGRGEMNEGGRGGRERGTIKRLAIASPVMLSLLTAQKSAHRDWHISRGPYASNTKGRRWGRMTLTISRRAREGRMA